MPLSPNFGGLVEGGKSGKGGKKSPFFPARVKEIILQPSTDINSLFVQNNGYPSIGYISFHPLNSVVDTENSANLIAAPLQINIRRLPLINEVVLILQSTDILNEDPQAQKYYYFSNVNIWNSIHHNGFPDLQNLDATQKQTNLVGFVSSTDGIVKKLDQSSKDLFLGNTFVEDPEIRNLFPVEGDVLVEGRFGNSLRFSHTAKSPSGSIQNPWSNSGLPTQPITIIRNGQTKQTPSIRWTPIFEDINVDASSIYLTNEQEIQMDFASKNLASYGLALTSSFSVVQIPNITIQAADKSLSSCDINELSDAEETIEAIRNPPIAYDISSSLSNITSSSPPTSITNNNPPTASLSPTVTKTINNSPGSSKQTAIPEQQLGLLTWAGEEVQVFEYQDSILEVDNYPDEDYLFEIDLNDPSLKVDAATANLKLPPLPPRVISQVTKGYDFSTGINYSWTVPKPKEGEMTISSGGLKKIISHEGSKPTVYDDKTGKKVASYDEVAGFPTVGIGHLIQPNEKAFYAKYLKPGAMSDAEMTNLLLRDLASRISDLNKKLKVKVTQGQFDALLSMGFNTGFGNKFFKRALALTNEGKMQEASAVINSGPKTSKGKEMAGLVRRRREESIQYLA